MAATRVAMCACPGMVLGAIVLGAMAASAMAGPFVADYIPGDPDLLIPFDPLNPGAAASADAVATLAGNFVRGLDMDSATSGWYLCTSSISASPTGLFRLDAGVSTLVSPLPSTFSGEGGLTLTPDNRTAFAAWSVSNADDLLYRISLPDGAFTLIGPIVLTGAGVTSSVLGLAMSSSGVLYTVDATTDALYTVSPATGVATLVGSLGQAVGGVGGLDFDGDTGELILAGNTGTTDIFRVDTLTGAATALGELVFGTSSIAWAGGGAPVCEPDINGDGVLNVFDVFAFFGAFGAGDLGADFAPVSGPDGVLNVFDIFEFFAQFGAGC